MGDNDGRESWSQVPDSGGMLWASDSGRVATLKHVGGGGFDVLCPRIDQFGDVFIMFDAKDKKNKVKKLVAVMVLEAFGNPRPGHNRPGHRDGDSSNCRLANLGWMLRGEGRVVDLKERRCLGRGCGAMFMSSGSNNRLCPVCASRVSNITLSGFEGVEESSDLPDEPLLGGGHHR